MKTFISFFSACLFALALTAQNSQPIDIKIKDKTAASIQHEASKDFGYGLKVSTDRAKTKAIALTNMSGEELFLVWGNGVVNTKKLFAEEVKVKVDAIGTTWPDYVFDPSYEKRSLGELRQFINHHHHLPGVPSADEVSQGYDVASMDAALLEQIELLTLYVFELQAEIEALKKASR